MANDIEQPIWTLRHDGERYEFPNLQRALSYADRLISRKSLVKHIHPEKRVIMLLSDRYNHPYCWEDIA